MAVKKGSRALEAESRQVAEEARETDWTAPSFLKEIFLGNYRLDLVHPFPDVPLDRPEFRAFMDRLERFLVEEVDSDRIDREGKVPPQVVKRLAELGVSFAQGYFVAVPQPVSELPAHSNVHPIRARIGR